MKILMVNKFLYPNGGSETYMLKLGEYLTSLGHEVEYFGMEHEDRCVGNSANSYTENMDFHNSGKLKQIKLSLKTIYSVEARKKIGIVLDKFKPDIVHLNNINFQLTPSIIYEIKKRNIPIVQTVHDVQIACPNHKMFIEEKGQNCQECLNKKYISCVKNKCLHNSTLKSVIAAIESYYYHTRNTYNLVDKYICPSGFIKDIITQAGVEKDRTIVLHNFCEKKKTIPEKSTVKPYVLYFGRLNKEKGVDTLIKVCKELPNIDFVFAGTGELADSCQDVENINAVGFKSGEELENLIADSVFSICPSAVYENCSMSIIESLALGTPVIASRIGGNPELVTENETGLLFEPGNQKELKQAIEKLFYNPSLVDKMSNNAYKNSTNDIEVYASKLIEVYNNSLLGMIK